MSNTSFYANLFLAMQAQIVAQCPWAWVEQDFGQDTLDKWRPNVNGFTGAILVDFNQTTYDDENRGQFGTVEISLRLLFYPFSQSYEGAPIEVKQEALSYFDLESDLVLALQGWQALDEQGAAYCQPLIRRSVRSNNRNDTGLRIRELIFSTAYEQDFDAHTVTDIDANIHVSIK